MFVSRRLATTKAQHSFHGRQWLGDLALSREKLESLWPPEYEEVKKIIIHHTASTVRDVNGDGALDGSDYRELVRAIYHYHASSKKWGDIGYQYIIDPDGTIYEGRFGGDGVVGGHAYRSRACTKFGPSNMPFNKGTIGISLLGTYQDQSITLQAHEALTTLIAEKAWEFEFEPLGSGFFRTGFTRTSLRIGTLTALRVRATPSTICSLKFQTSASRSLTSLGRRVQGCIMQR